MFRTRYVVQAASFFFLAVVGLPNGSAAEGKPTNVLLIVADDLRTELGCFGSVAKTPNIDGLAKRGVLFEHAYCQQAVCNPSRSSFLTGQRPDTLGLWCNGTHFRELNPNVVTLPELLKRNGYVTRDVGKIFHNWHTKVHGDPQSWSAPEFLHYANHGNDKPEVNGAEKLKNFATAPKVTNVDVPDPAFYDGRVADEAVRVLGEIKDKPFFLAVGFWKPHAPFNAPKKYWDLYDRASLPKLDPRWPKNGPAIAKHDSRELLGFDDTRITISAADAAEWRHGYLANTSYMDAQVGKVLDALQKSGVADNTLVIFMSDHGYHLGEHEQWGKTSCFELDAHVPLIIVPPGSKQPAKVASVVELVDLFPTITGLCNLKVDQKLAGTSLQPLLTNPQGAVKQAAFTQHPRPAYYDRTESKTPTTMGYSVRTADVRYTEWRDWSTGNVVARELYNQRSDPHELNNSIDSPADPTALQTAVSVLHQQFPPEIPPAKLARNP
jgi:iduronate 2-sulfatase